MSRTGHCCTQRHPTSSRHQTLAVVQAQAETAGAISSDQTSKRPPARRIAMQMDVVDAGVDGVGMVISVGVGPQAIDSSIMFLVAVCQARLDAHRAGVGEQETSRDHRIQHHEPTAWSMTVRSPSSDWRWPSSRRRSPLRNGLVCGAMFTLGCVVTTTSLFTFSGTAPRTARVNRRSDCAGGFATPSRRRGRPPRQPNSPRVHRARAVSRACGGGVAGCSSSRRFESARKWTCSSRLQS